MKRPAANDPPAAKRQDTGARPKSILKKKETPGAVPANVKKAGGTSQAILRANTKSNAKSTAAAYAAEAEQQKSKEQKSASKNNAAPETAAPKKATIAKQKGAQPTSQKQQPKAVLKIGSAQRKSGAVKKPTKKSAAGSDSDNDGEDERDTDNDADEEEESDADDEEEEDGDDDDLEGIQAPAKKSSKKNTEESMAEAMSKILGSTLRKADASQPILARSRGIERKLEEEKLEAKARKALTMEKKRSMNKDRVKPDYTGMEYEKKLRKVATRGVVQLFNAIKAQQKVTESVTDKIAPIGANAKDKVANMTKASFLDLLKSGTKVAAV
ncbi:hypothetical protein BGZ73_008876 [Actinomortierella ambigua]|nr:hypothetical protein BGZ73_008876 [Actinomortierella ambigua]